MKPSRGLKEERKGRRLSLLSFSLCATVCLSTCQSLNVACRSSSCTNWGFFPPALLAVPSQTMPQTVVSSSPLPAETVHHPQPPQCVSAS